MSRISEIVSSLRFAVNMESANPTRYRLPNHSGTPKVGFKHTQLFSRKMFGDFNKPDVYVPEQVEEKTQNIKQEVVQRVKTPKKSHRRPIREVAEKYFDNDSPSRDYAIFLEDLEAKSLEQQVKSRTVENADEIRKFVERGGKEEGYQYGHGFDHEELMRGLEEEVLSKNKAIENKYTQKTDKYFNEIKEGNEYRNYLVESEEKEEAERLKQEKLNSIIEPYIEGFNPKSHKIQIPRYPYNQGYKDNHNKVQRSNKSVKFY